ncbi:MAG: hypothetical protein AMXMBFR81_31330 [Chthonomonas sp.]
MIATPTKGSGGTFQVSARRYTDPWGVTRVGASSGSPDQRYCASLGHRQDDESCLTYMRARYYEPTTGRFISEDPAMDGMNWFVYAKNTPTIAVDATGMYSEDVWGATIKMLLGLYSSYTTRVFVLAVFVGIGVFVAGGLYPMIGPFASLGGALYLIGTSTIAAFRRVHSEEGVFGRSGMTLRGSWLAPGCLQVGSEEFKIVFLAAIQDRSAWG